MSDFRPGAPSYWSEIVVVSRRLNVPPRRVHDLLSNSTVLPVATAFDLDGVWSWRLDQPILPKDWPEASAQATGRLGRSCRIELAVSGWTSDSTELRLHPATRHIRWWTARKQRRSFDLAHLCADDIVRRLAAAARAPVPRQCFDLERTALVLVGGRA